MSVDLERFGIDRLSISERLELIDKIWESLPAEVASEDVPASHLAEVRRRYADAEASPGVGRPFREVL